MWNKYKNNDISLNNNYYLLMLGSLFCAKKLYELDFYFIFLFLLLFFDTSLCCILILFIFDYTCYVIIDIGKLFEFY
jgi:hypothetical protein